MKKKQVSFILLAVLIFTLTVSNSFPRHADGDFYSNPYVLNGKSVNFENLSTLPTGRLSIVKTDPIKDQKFKIPFHAYIRRGGKIIDAEAYAHNHAVTEVELSEVLRLAKPGDELVIDPVKKVNGMMQRSVILKSKVVMPPFQWFFEGEKTKDRC